MSLRFVKSNGALSDDFLTAICSLYGKNVDNRYSRIDFVRSVFNGNPFGHSYAVFVFDDDRPVGCHAIVPIAVLSRGVLLRGGKFEAFFLEEGYRKQRAGAEHDKALPGVLLITLLQALAFERGVEVIFTLTTEKVGPLYRSKGFHKVPAVLDHRYFLLQPAKIRQLQADSRKLALARGLAIGQKLVHTMAAPFSGTSGFEVNQKDHLAGQIQRAARTNRFDASRWSIAMTEEALRWWLDLGYIEIITVDSNPEEFVIVTRGCAGGTAEILQWNIQEGNRRRALGILRFLVGRAARDGAVALSFANAHRTRHPSLAVASALSGFVRKSVERVFYVKAQDPFHYNPEALEFNWLFSL